MPERTNSSARAAAARFWASVSTAWPLAAQGYIAHLSSAVQLLRIAARLPNASGTPPLPSPFLLDAFRGRVAAHSHTRFRFRTMLFGTKPASTPVVVFDLDGTLIDTAPDLVMTLNAIFAREGLP